MFLIITNYKYKRVAVCGCLCMEIFVKEKDHYKSRYEFGEYLAGTQVPGYFSHKNSML